MAYGYKGKGDVIKVTLSGTVTANTIAVLDSIAGVYTQSGVSGDVVGVALEGVHTIAKSASAVSGFAQGDKVYALTANGNPTTSATSSVPLGIAVEACTTGATSMKVKLCSF